MFRIIFLLCIATAALIGIAAPLATTDYVNKKAAEAVKEANKYTDAHAPKIDLSGYVTTNAFNFRVDSATNVVWKCVWSNGVEYVYAYSNIVKRVAQ